METSVKLENMEKHFNDILTLIDSNQNLKRYLYYNSDNPLKVSASQPDISISLIDDNIKLSFFDDKIPDGKKIFLFLNPLKSGLSKVGIGEEKYLFDIVIPNQYWRLKGMGQFRSIRIGMELCKMLDQQAVTGIGKIIAGDVSFYKLNNYYQAMTFPITVSTSNMTTNR